MSIEVKVPVLPESVTDATIAAWHKKAGEAVKRDENLVDLETDKVVLEVPAPADGMLKEIRHQTGDTVNSEDVIAVLEEGAVAEAPKAAEEKKETKQPEAQAKTEAAAKPGPGTGDSGLGKSTAGAESLSPAAARLAAEEKIDTSKVQGTGRGGQVTKEDLVNFQRSPKPAAAPGPESRAPSPAPSRVPGPAIPGSRPEERVPMTRIRAKIAERLMQSKNSIAMLTSSN